ncbi:hypothetical protein ES707_11810 [subsurface metagenome]
MGRIFLILGGDNDGTAKPSMTALSEKITLFPPPPPTIKMPSPPVSGRDENARIASAHSFMQDTGVTPVCSKKASHRRWLPAMLPVWDATVPAPTSVCPPFRRTMGFRGVVPWASSKRRLPSRTLSRYIAMTSISSSLAIYSR